jgi:hypothetical protein
MEHFTRVTQHSSTTIDLLITNTKHLKYEVHLSPKITDHSIISIDMTTKQNTSLQSTRTIRNYKRLNELQFQLDVMQEEWDPSCTNVNVLAENMVNNIERTINKHIPLEEKVIREEWGHKKWWTQIIGEEIKKRDEYYKQAIITQRDREWIGYRQQRNKVVTMIRTQKKKYYEDNIDKVKNEPIKMWSTLKQLTMEDKNRSYSKNGILFNSELITDSKTLAEKFNGFFLDSIEEIVQPIQKSKTPEEIVLSIQETKSKMNLFKQLKFPELKSLIRKMKNKQSSVDGINTKILKLTFETIGDRFLHVINTSLETGKFPNKWKTTTVIPIEKKINTNRCEEFRPINMVPIYEKLLELVVNSQIVEYIENNNILCEYQSGFRKGNSCESALQTILFNWKNAIEQKLIIGAVFLDLRRAFETIDRQLLILKMQKYGFGPTIVSWLQEYLTDRTQVTKYDNHVSMAKTTSYGVPQGTVLGPNLFILYINDIVQCLKKCSIQLFADDMLLYIMGDNVDSIINNLQEELRGIQDWLSNNNLVLNIDKTKFMIIKCKYNTINRNNNLILKIHNTHIEQVETFKYLGIIIDENLSFKNHASYVTNKIAKKINLLGRIGRDLSVWSKLTIYNTIISPHLKYCATILYLLNSTEISVLQKKQNRALRHILGCNKYTNIKLMLTVTNMLSVKQTIIFNTMLFIYKIINGMLPPLLYKYVTFVKDIHDHNTRSKDDFYINTVSTTYSQNNLYHKGLKQFNELPTEIKQSSNYNSFKRKCKVYIRDYIDI